MWARINDALSLGLRGLPNGSSLPKLLAEHRGIRNKKDLPSLTIKQILAWADAHKAATGDWPNVKSGQVAGTDETWLRINTALSVGLRGLPSGSSLAKLLVEYRGKLNQKGLESLTIEQILTWADTHKAATGGWPNIKSGEVAGTDETWARINASLQQGLRGLPDGSSLPKVLAEHRGIRNKKALPSLTIKQILALADAQKAATGDWPNMQSGPVAGTDETWSGINAALSQGLRGLPSGSSLAKLLGEHRGRRNIHGLPDLAIGQILDWADKHKQTTGKWPSVNSGQITGIDQSWASINASPQEGLRGLPSGSSLAKLLAEHRGKRNQMDLPYVTIDQILAWADEYQAVKGEWPKKNSGQIEATDETWARINDGLQKGLRGLPSGSSLAKVLAEHRGVRNHMDLRPLTIEQILQWADAHRRATSYWPTTKSGQVAGTDEFWRRIDDALFKGLRGLPGGSSLAKLFAQRGMRSP